MYKDSSLMILLMSGLLRSSISKPVFISDFIIFSRSRGRGSKVAHLREQESRNRRITVLLLYEKARADLAFSLFVPTSRSLLDVSVIHPGKAAAAYHAIDTIDRLWRTTNAAI